MAVEPLEKLLSQVVLNQNAGSNSHYFTIYGRFRGFPDSFARGSVGNPGIWAERFKSFDTRFLECVVAIWPRCLKALPAQPDEDTVTANLVDILSRDANARRLFHYIEYHYEPFGYAETGEANSNGVIDLAVLLDQNRERYLAYECRRLNVIYNSERHSLATRYVKEGAIRFVSGKYSEGLPVGCMLGYVLDGGVSDAKFKVHAAMNENKSLISLAEELEELQPIGCAERFSCRHNRLANGQQIEVRHAFLPISVQGSCCEQLG